MRNRCVFKFFSRHVLLEVQVAVDSRLTKHLISYNILCSVAILVLFI